MAARIPVHPITPAPIIVEGVQDVPTRPNAPPRGGWRFAQVRPQEVLDVGGHRVTLGHRSDGQYTAWVRDTTKKTGRRAYYGSDRDALLARMAADLVDHPPTMDPPPIIAPGRTWRAIPPGGRPARPNGRGDWHVVQVAAGGIPHRGGPGPPGRFDGPRPGGPPGGGESGRRGPPPG